MAETTVGKRGLKLHSIIEKLSEQCGRTSPNSQGEPSIEVDTEAVIENPHEQVGDSTGLQIRNEECEVINIETVDVAPVVVHINSGGQVKKKRGRPPKIRNEAGQGMPVLVQVGGAPKSRKRGWPQKSGIAIQQKAKKRKEVSLKEKIDRLIEKNDVALGRNAVKKVTKKPKRSKVQEKNDLLKEKLHKNIKKDVKLVKRQPGARAEDTIKRKRKKKKGKDIEKGAPVEEICINVNALMAVNAVQLPPSGQPKPKGSTQLVPLISRKDNVQRVDDDLCININALICTTPQVDDIDVVNVNKTPSPTSPAPAEAENRGGSCRLCCTPVSGIDEFLEHFRDAHPECIRNYVPKPGQGQSSEKEGSETAANKKDEQEEEESEEDWESDESVEFTEPNDPDFEEEIGEALGDEDDAEFLRAATVPSSNKRRRSTRIAAQHKANMEEAPVEPEEVELEEEEEVEEDIEVDVDGVSDTEDLVIDVGTPEEEDNEEHKEQKQSKSKDMPKKTKTISCKSCEEMFYWEAQLFFHVVKEHPESEEAQAEVSEEKKNFCDHCNKKFFWKEALRLHIDKVVGILEGTWKPRVALAALKPEKPPKPLVFKCNICKRQMKSKGNLNKHLRVAHSDERPFKCEVCPMTFKDKEYLRRHKVVHSGEKNYKCDHCGKLFAHRGSLKSHIMIHTGVRPHKCQYCEMGFISRHDLRVHENRHTGNFPYKCNVCSKAFPKSYGLTMHMFCHSTEKPHKCEVCGKGFKRRDHLRLHKVIHSDVKPFKCDTCGREFNQHICLRKHLPCREQERREKREQAAAAREEKQAQVKPRKPRAPSGEAKNQKEKATGEVKNQKEKGNKGAKNQKEKEKEKEKKKPSEEKSKGKTKGEKGKGRGRPSKKKSAVAEEQDDETAKDNSPDDLEETEGIEEETSESHGAQESRPSVVVKRTSTADANAGSSDSSEQSSNGQDTECVRPQHLDKDLGNYPGGAQLQRSGMDGNGNVPMRQSPRLSSTRNENEEGAQFARGTQGKQTSRLNSYQNEDEGMNINRGQNDRRSSVPGLSFDAIAEVTRNSVPGTFPSANVSSEGVSSRYQEPRVPYSSEPRYGQSHSGADLMGVAQPPPLHTPPLLDMRSSRGEPTSGHSTAPLNRNSPLNSMNTRISSPNSMPPSRHTTSYPREMMHPLSPLSSGPYSTPGRMYQQPRYPDPCMFNSSGPAQPYIPYSSIPEGTAMYHGGTGLAMDSMHPSSHGNPAGHIMIDRPYTHDTPSELSNALFSAMDPDHLGNMVDHSNMFFPNA